MSSCLKGLAARHQGHWSPTFKTAVIRSIFGDIGVPQLGVVSSLLLLTKILLKWLPGSIISYSYSVLIFLVVLCCSDYDAYFDTLPIFAGNDQSLFWSGTLDIVSVISQNDLGATVVSSTNTPSAAIINGVDDRTEGYLDWCGRRICKCGLVLLAPGIL